MTVDARGVPVPASLDWLRSTPAGRAWLESLPGLVEAAVARWSLRTGPPYPGGHAALTLPAVRGDGTPVVLKLPFPDRESRHEGEALRRWAGHGAVRLLDQEPGLPALLLERCVPGTHLGRAGSEVALDVLTGLLPRLWLPAGEPFTDLADEAAGWRANLEPEWERAGRPFARRLVDAATETMRDLAASQPERMLVHQDLHGDNVLRATREPWLVIDPKPLAGERAFALAPVIRSAELGHGRREVLHRLDRLTAELGVDRERARGWAFAQTLAWGFEAGRVLPEHLDVAGWLVG